MTGPGRATPGRRAYPAREAPASRRLATTQHTKGSGCTVCIPRFGSQLPNTDQPHDEALDSPLRLEIVAVGGCFFPRRCISTMNRISRTWISTSHTGDLIPLADPRQECGRRPRRRCQCEGAPSRGPGRRRQRQRQVGATSSSAASCTRRGDELAIAALADQGLSDTSCEETVSGQSSRCRRL